MSAGIRQIGQRRKAAQSIGRLTRTMQVVSTARFKSLHRQRMGEVEYHEALAQAGYLLVSGQENVSHPLLEENQSGKHVLLAIGSKAGLCGGYNNQVWHKLHEQMQLAEQTGKELEIVAPSSRLVHHLKSRGVKISEIYEDLYDLPSHEQIERIADSFVERYQAGELDSFGIVYMQFISASKQSPQTMTIMPLAELIDYLMNTVHKDLWPWDLTLNDFEASPSVSELVDSLARIIIDGSIRACFLDALLSEHVARMVAMRSASKNADTMITELSQQFNRARQAQITAELLDIIGGTGALE